MTHGHGRETQGHNCGSLWAFFALLLLPGHPQLATVSNRLLTSVDLRLIPALFLLMVQKVMVLP